MDFSEALVALRDGLKLQRTGWNGVGLFVFLVPGSTFQVNRALLRGIYPEGTTIKYRPHLDLRAADGTIGTWQPSHTDLLAKDWQVVPDTQP